MLRLFPDIASPCPPDLAISTKQNSCKYRKHSCNIFLYSHTWTEGQWLTVGQTAINKRRSNGTQKVSHFGLLTKAAKEKKKKFNIPFFIFTTFHLTPPPEGAQQHLHRVQIDCPSQQVGALHRWIYMGSIFGGPTPAAAHPLQLSTAHK